MQIDWFTVIAQIINFLILVYLLKRLLYSRVVRAMDEREEKIASRLEDAKDTKQKAEEELGEYREKKVKIEAERNQIIGSAKKEAEEKLKELMIEAKQEVDKKKQSWSDYLEQEQASFLESMKEQVASEVVKLSRRVLTRVANAELEREAVNAFLNNLDGLSDDDRKPLLGRDGESKNSITVVSAFDLNDDVQKKIADKVKEVFGSGIAPEFEASDELVMGIQLRGEGHKIGWSVSDYLDGMEERMSTLIKEEAREQVSSGKPEETKSGNTGNESEKEAKQQD